MKIPALLTMALLLAASASQAQPPFGGPDDIAYASRLWQALIQANLVGSNAIQSKAYPGQHPHGAVLQTIYTSLNLEGQDNRLIVKRNYGGDGVSVQSVAENPDRFLAAVTVMYQRPGYDPDNGNWFWAKYLPDGSLDKNPKGMQLAGRVAKVNPPAGCIACHNAAPGGDMVFTK
ncbi:MAG: cytochrome P460 family protein [Gammaproteobacteria bacterium]